MNKNTKLGEIDGGKETNPIIALGVELKLNETSKPATEDTILHVLLENPRADNQMDSLNRFLQSKIHPLQNIEKVGKTLYQADTAETNIEPVGKMYIIVDLSFQLR